MKMTSLKHHIRLTEQSNKDIESQWFADIRIRDQQAHDLKAISRKVE